MEDGGNKSSAVFFEKVKELTVATNMLDIQIIKYPITTSAVSVIPQLFGTIIILVWYPHHVIFWWETNQR